MHVGESRDISDSNSRPSGRSGAICSTRHGRRRVAAAEVEFNDLWQLADSAFVAVAKDAGHVEEALTAWGTLRMVASEIEVSES